MDMHEILTPPKTIAVIGLSDKPERSSYEVATYLHDEGFVIIPVNPNVQRVLGVKSYARFSDIPAETPIDIVDIFRRSEEVMSIVEEVIASGRKPVIWMQEGVISEEAKALAESHGMTVIMNACMMKKRKALSQL